MVASKALSLSADPLRATTPVGEPVRKLLVRRGDLLGDASGNSVVGSKMESNSSDPFRLMILVGGPVRKLAVRRGDLALSGPR